MRMWRAPRLLLSIKALHQPPLPLPIVMFTFSRAGLPHMRTVNPTSSLGTLCLSSSSQEGSRTLSDSMCSCLSVPQLGYPLYYSLNDYCTNASSVVCMLQHPQWPIGNHPQEVTVPWSWEHGVLRDGLRGHRGGNIAAETKPKVGRTSSGELGGTGWEGGRDNKGLEKAGTTGGAGRSRTPGRVHPPYGHSSCGCHRSAAVATGEEKKPVRKKKKPLDIWDVWGRQLTDEEAAGGDGENLKQAPPF